MLGFIKNRYCFSSRTFIQPTQGQRERAVRIKLNAIKETVQGKSVVLIDDSIVRGTTGGRIIKLLREAGAKEVHLRISSPPFLNPCYFGTDIDSRDKLIACKHTVKEIADLFGADSLGFLAADNLCDIAKDANTGFCVGCFTGEYPVPEPNTKPVHKFEKKITERLV